MERNLCSIDLDTLKTMYDAEATKLRESLISGSSWEELRDQRRTVTELAIALHQKRLPGNNPAESALRNPS